MISSRARAYILGSCRALIAGAKYHVIKFASTRGHEKQPAATDVKVSQTRGKTTDLATQSGSDALPSLARCAARPISERPSALNSSRRRTLHRETRQKYNLKTNINIALR